MILLACIILIIDFTDNTNAVSCRCCANDKIAISSSSCAEKLLPLRAKWKWEGACKKKQRCTPSSPFHIKTAETKIEQQIPPFFNQTITPRRWLRQHRYASDKNRTRWEGEWQWKENEISLPVWSLYCVHTKTAGSISKNWGKQHERTWGERRRLLWTYWRKGEAGVMIIVVKGW